MIMDSALFITSLFALVSALTTFFAADQAFGYGFVTLLLVGLVGGFAFYLMYYFVYQYYGPDMDRSQRPPFWKSVLVILASMFLWLLVFFATSFLPASLNPVLAPLPLAIIWSSPPSPSLLSQETLEHPQRKCRTNTLLERKELLAYSQIFSSADSKKF